eukprot:gnl/Spiro4/23066_TR11400_c0_g2_i2.p1 gnl/Spiro4/23066_TR11400_c0_g2~~gnl/Spiro4/23066_TR11400_c0_g2_i2.p1  ORF type:complete len:379 (+),score=36.68 gnl/Spiro4/23066_TR11400_c0_g2_i2:503-1639(+)
MVLSCSITWLLRVKIEYTCVNTESWSVFVWPCALTRTTRKSKAENIAYMRAHGALKCVHAALNEYDTYETVQQRAAVALANLSHATQAMGLLSDSTQVMGLLSNPTGAMGLFARLPIDLVLRILELVLFARPPSPRTIGRLSCTSRSFCALIASPLCHAMWSGFGAAVFVLWSKLSVFPKYIQAQFLASPMAHVKHLWINSCFHCGTVQKKPHFVRRFFGFAVCSTCPRQYDIYDAFSATECKQMRLRGALEGFPVPAFCRREVQRRDGSVVWDRVTGTIHLRSQVVQLLREQVGDEETFIRVRRVELQRAVRNGRGLVPQERIDQLLARKTVSADEREIMRRSLKVDQNPFDLVRPAGQVSRILERYGLINCGLSNS